MKNFKKIVAFGMTMVMLIGSSLSAMATEPEETESTNTQYDAESDGNKITAGGSFSGIIPMDVVTVTVSTHTEDDYKFVLDPQKLIYESVFNDIDDTSEEAYDQDYFDDAGKTDNTKIPTAYFKKYARTINDIGVVSDDAATYYQWTDTSTPIYAINKGLNDVNIGLTSKVTVDPSIEVSANKSFGGAGYTKTAIYVGIKEVKNPGITAAGAKGVAASTIDEAAATATVPVALDPTTGASQITAFDTIDKNVLGAVLGGAAGNVSVSYNNTAKKYELIRNTAADGNYFKHIGFELEVAANPKGIWKTADLAKQPSVDFTWDLSVKGTPTVTLSTAGVLTVEGMTKDENAVTMDMYVSDGLVVKNFAAWDMEAATTDTTQWTDEGGTVKLTFPQVTLDYVKGKTVTAVVNFNSGSTVVATPTAFAQ